MERSRIFLILIIVQVFVIAGLSLWDGQEASLDFDPGLFTVADAQQIDQILIEGPAGKVTLGITTDGGKVNEKYELDKSLRQVLLSMVEQWQVKRPVSKTNNQEIIKELREQGAHVMLLGGGSPLISFFAGGVASQKITYFYRPDDERAYIIDIPGYTNYISAIFNLTELQWKDRKLFESPWQSIQSLTIERPSTPEDDISFSYKNSFPGIDQLNMNKVDTARMINYLEQFAYFETNEHVDISRFDQFDSLSRTPPIGKIKLTDLDPSMSNELTIWARLPQDRVHLTLDSRGNWSVIERRRVQALLPSKNSFLRVERPF